MIAHIKRLFAIFCFIHVTSLLPAVTISSEPDSINLVTFFNPGHDLMLGGAVTNGLSKAIQEKQFCIVDFDNLKNLYLKHITYHSSTTSYVPKEFSLNSVPDLQKNWLIYSHPNNSLFVLIPKETGQTPSELGFNDNLKLINFEKNLSPQLKYKYYAGQETPIDMQNFGELFDTSIQIPRRFIFIGHGSPGFIIGITTNEYKKLLNILNTLSTDFVVIVSCFIGGENLLAHYQTTMKSNASIPLDYTIVVTGPTNNVVEWEATFKKFFDNIDEFYKKTPKTTLSYKSLLAPFNFSIAAMPLIRFPGTDFFRVVDVDGLVESITYHTLSRLKLQRALAQKLDPAKLMKQDIPWEAIITQRLRLRGAKSKPLTINVSNKKQAILLYPTVINVPITIQQNKKFPMIVSMFPVQSRHFLKSINASKFTLDQVISGFLLQDLPKPTSTYPESFFIQNLTCIVNDKITTLEQVVIYRHIPMPLSTKAYSGPVVLFKYNDNFYSYIPETKEMIPLSEPADKFVAHISSITKPHDNILKSWSGEQDSNKNFESIVEQAFAIRLPSVEPEPIVKTKPLSLETIQLQREYINKKIHQTLALVPNVMKLGTSKSIHQAIIELAQTITEFIQQEYDTYIMLNLPYKIETLLYDYTNILKHVSLPQEARELYKTIATNYPQWQIPEPVTTQTVHNIVLNNAVKIIVENLRMILAGQIPFDQERIDSITTEIKILQEQAIQYPQDISLYAFIKTANEIMDKIILWHNNNPTITKTINNSTTDINNLPTLMIIENESTKELLRRTQEAMQTNNWPEIKNTLSQLHKLLIDSNIYNDYQEPSMQLYIKTIQEMHQINMINTQFLAIGKRYMTIDLSNSFAQPQKISLHIQIQTFLENLKKIHYTKHVYQQIISLYKTILTAIQNTLVPKQ